MSYDVIVIGAGPAGLSFAKMLGDQGLSVAIIEKQSRETLENPSYDGREIALTHHAHAVMTEAGIWRHLPAREISLVKDAKVLNGDSNRALHFDHRQSGKKNLGFMVSNHLIRRAAFAAMQEAKNVTLLSDTEVKGITTDAARGTVTLKNGKKLQAALIVAADSRFSHARELMKVGVDTLDFKRTCIVCRMKIDKSHSDTAYECFFYDRTLAVLPLNRNHCSVVITLDTKDKGKVLDISPEEFGRDITKRMQGKFGNMTLESRLFPYPLVSIYARSFHAQRFALLGDAAVGMHPVTAHGFNFGLRGGHVLSGEIAKARALGLDIGSAQVLENYDRAHRAATLAMYHGTNALVGLYTRTSPAAKLARMALLGIAKHAPPVKKIIMNRLTEAG
jgi:ubiquinone biosynthesis UbiH/UbiF/VisC/COQ6 family hydroxylase